MRKRHFCFCLLLVCFINKVNFPHFVESKATDGAGARGQTPGGLMIASRIISGQQNVYLSAVRGLLQGLLPPGEPEDSPALAHRRETVRMRARGLQQSLLQCLGPSQTPESDTFQRGRHLEFKLSTVSIGQKMAATFKIKKAAKCK